MTRAPFRICCRLVVAAALLQGCGDDVAGPDTYAARRNYNVADSLIRPLVRSRDLGPMHGMASADPSLLPQRPNLIAYRTATLTFADVVAPGEYVVSESLSTDPASGTTTRYAESQALNHYFEIIACTTPPPAAGPDTVGIFCTSPSNADTVVGWLDPTGREFRSLLLRWNHDSRGSTTYTSQLVRLHLQNIRYRREGDGALTITLNAAELKDHLTTLEYRSTLGRVEGRPPGATWQRGEVHRTTGELPTAGTITIRLKP